MWRYQYVPLLGLSFCQSNGEKWDFRTFFFNFAFPYFPVNILICSTDLLAKMSISSYSYLLFGFTCLIAFSHTLLIFFRVVFFLMICGNFLCEGIGILCLLYILQNTLPNLLSFNFVYKVFCYSEIKILM